MGAFCGVSKLTPCQLITLTNALTALMSDGCDADDLNALGNLLAAVGALMMTAASSSSLNT